MTHALAALLATPTPVASVMPTIAPPPGQSDPLVGVLAALAIIVAAAAGFFVYRAIRKGL